MARFDALSIRDLVSLTVIAASTVGGHPVDVDHAFKVADEFVAQSEGRWADRARANHVKRSERDDVRK